MPLVAGELRAEPDDAELAAVGAHGLGRGHCALAAALRRGRQAVGIQVQAALLQPVGRPDLIADPAPGNVRDGRTGPARVHDVGAKGRILVDAGIDALEVAVPPAQRLLQKTDARLGHGEMRVLVRPGADDAPGGRLQRAHQARHRIGVGIVPAAHGQHGGVDGADVLVDGAVFPVGIAVRVFQPGDGQQRLGLQPLQPHGAPALAHQRRIRRTRGVGMHRGRPAQVLTQQAAALVMDVVGVAVVGGAQRDHRLERRRPQRGDLQAVEAAPRDAHHAHLAGAPGLLRQPGDHVAAVLQFLCGVFVVHQALGVAIAAHVHPHAGIPVAGQIGVGQRIAHMGTVPFAVGQVFQDHRHRLLPGVGRHPDACGQLCAVGQGDEEVGGFADFAREGFDGFHAGPAFTVESWLCGAVSAELCASAGILRQGAAAACRVRVPSPGA